MPSASAMSPKPKKSKRNTFGDLENVDLDSFQESDSKETEEDIAMVPSLKEFAEMAVEKEPGSNSASSGKAS